MDEENGPIEQDQGREIPAAAPQPITTRFLFVGVAALRAKQLRRGARLRFQASEGSTGLQKAEGKAMEEVRRGLVYYEVGAASTAQAGRGGAEREA